MLRGRLTKKTRNILIPLLERVCRYFCCLLRNRSDARTTIRRLWVRSTCCYWPVNIYLPMDYADAFTSARIQCCIFWLWEVLWMLSENYHRFPSDSRGGKNSGEREEMANVMHNSSSHPCHHPSSKWTRHQHHHRAIIPVLPLQNRHVNGLSHNLLCESKQMPFGCVVTFRN